MSDMCVDREEVEKIVDTRLAVFTERIDGQFNLINQKLETIQSDGRKTLEQAIKTNGRVTSLERRAQDYDRHIEDTKEYPRDLRKLQDDNLTSKIQKSFIIKAVGIGVTLLSVLIPIIYKLLDKIFTSIS